MLKGQPLSKTSILLYTMGGFFLFLLLIPVRNSFALTSNDISNGLVNGGSVWLETTLIVALSHVSAVAFSLQIARGYFIRVLSKFTLRLGADVWWMVYVLVRDALIILSFVIGLLVFLPGTFLDYPMAVPFMPVAVVLFGAALLTKLVTDADESRKAFRLVTLLIFTGAFLWITGTIFITESPLQLATLPTGVSATSGFWYEMIQLFSSQSNLSLTMASFELCLVGLGALGIFGLAYSIFRWSPRPSKKTLLASTYNQAPIVRTLPGNESSKNEIESYYRNRDDLTGQLDHFSLNEQKNNRPNYIG